MSCDCPNSSFGKKHTTKCYDETIGKMLQYHNEDKARISELEAVVRDAECLLTIVEPRSHKQEYLALLRKARKALGMIPAETGEKL